MEVGRGAKERCTRCQEPAEMIFIDWPHPTPILHPIDVCALSEQVHDDDAPTPDTCTPVTPPIYAL